MKRALLIAALVCACTRSSADATPTPAPPPMTNNRSTGPSAADWKTAKDLAAKQGAGAVEQRSAALPFLFSAERAKCVLVHKGAVVTKRGPAVAGGYLRDLGIAQGKGPGLDDVLWALWALDALPKLDLPEEGYVSSPGTKRLAELTARIEHDGHAAHVILHWLKPDAPPPADVQRGPSGGRTTGATTRAIVRMTLDIPASGDAAWRREDLTWADPG